MYPDEELINLINHGESDLVEFTQSAQDMDKIRKAICAFANDLPNRQCPGVIFIGINDDGNCSNLTINDSLLKTLGGLRSDGKIMPFPTMTVEKKHLQNCDVAVIQVKPSDNPPIKMSNRCWIRTGPTQAQASAEEERSLTEKRRWGNLPYDMHEVATASIENDIDMRRFENEYLPSAVSPEALEENNRNAKEQLKSLRLTAQDGTPTVTAILMLGKSPRDWFPGAYIQFVRYDGAKITDDILDQKEINGTLPDQLMELDKILKVNITNALDTSGERHVEKPNYPYEAARELARNAVIHKNYESANTPVRIDWFIDNIQITSPGGVYGTVTRQNFGEPNITDYRNPTIAEALKNMGFMERFGRGIAIARNRLSENGNPPLDFIIEDNFIQITIKAR